jgi:hypothetical protein
MHAADAFAFVCIFVLMERKHVMVASADGVGMKFLRAWSISNKASTTIINSTLVGGEP